MKKLLALMLTLVLCFALVGCGQDANNDASTDNSVVEESTTDEASVKESSVEESSEADDEVTVMSYADYVAADLDTAVVVETYVQAKQGWWQDKATLYTQNEDGAFFIYELPCSQDEYDKLTTGTKIRVSGYKSEWKGEVEIIDATYEILEGNFVAEATDVTALLGTDDLIKEQNKLVAFKGMTIVAAGQDAEGNDVPYLYAWDGSGTEGDDLYFNVTDAAGQQFTFTVESYLCSKDTDVYKAVQGLQIGDKVDMEGFLYWYDGVNPHITSVTVVTE